MARSTYIYVVSYRVGDGAPVLARTVKYELVNVLSHFTGAALDGMDVWRVYDGGSGYSPEHRTHLGSGTEFLARECPEVAEIKASLARLDGTTASAVGLLTGYTPEQLDALGGFQEKPDAA